MCWGTWLRKYVWGGYISINSLRTTVLFYWMNQCRPLAGLYSILQSLWLNASWLFYNQNYWLYQCIPGINKVFITQWIRVIFIILMNECITTVYFTWYSDVHVHVVWLNLLMTFHSRYDWMYQCYFIAHMTEHINVIL